MSKDDPQAPAKAGGQQSFADRDKDAVAMSDDELRHHGAARLAEHLDIATDLVERCGQLAGMREGDRVSPIYAAARLLQANAQIAKALGYVAQAEIRRRTIVEHIQLPVAKTADLNCSLENRLATALRLKMLGYMTLLAHETLDPALREALAEATGTHEEDKAPPPAPETGEA